MNFKTQKMSVFEKTLWHMAPKTNKQKKTQKMKKNMYFFFMKKNMPKLSVYKAINPLIFSPLISKPDFFAFEKKQKNLCLPMNKAKILLFKRFWFFQTAYALAGVLSVKKRNLVYQTKKMRYRTVQNWLMVQKKKTLCLFFTQNKIANLSKNWNVFVKMESLLQSVLRKTIFCSSGPQKKRLVSSHLIQTNGLFQKQTFFVNSPADLVGTDQIDFLFEKMYKHYAVSRPLFL